MLFFLPRISVTSSILPVLPSGDVPPVFPSPCLGLPRTYVVAMSMAEGRSGRIGDRFPIYLYYFLIISHSLFFILGTLMVFIY